MLCLRGLGLFCECPLRCPAQLGGSLVTICLPRLCPAGVRSTLLLQALPCCCGVCPAATGYALWRSLSAMVGCLGSGGRPSPTERLGPSARDSSKSRFCSSHWVSQTICSCNTLGWPTVQVSFSLKSSPLKSQVAGSTGHPDKRALWGLLGRAGRRRPGCWLRQADLLPGIPCLFYTWEFPCSVGNKDQSGNAALTHRLRIQRELRSWVVLTAPS